MQECLYRAKNPLPPEFDKYAFKLAPDRLHHALFYATMYIGEGATTASECAMLGTPALYVNTISVGIWSSRNIMDYYFVSAIPQGLLKRRMIY